MIEVRNKAIEHVGHLVYAVPDLTAGIAQIEDLFGVAVQLGGRHSAFGTANALMALGNSRYLEIVGPDPDRADVSVPILFQLDRIDGPKLVTWAAKAYELTTRAADGLVPAVLGDVSSGSRTRVDGTTVGWQVSDPYTDRLGGVIPFLIDWTGSAHPTESLDQPCVLTQLDLGHPHPHEAAAALEALGIGQSVHHRPDPELVATISTPTGEHQLR